MSEDALVSRILRDLAKLEPDALAVVARIVERLVAGRLQYGDLVLAIDRRDFVEESLQEALDLSNYLACALEQIKRLRGAP